MVVSRPTYRCALTLTVVLTAVASTCVPAQELRAWVDSTTVKQNVPFWLFVEAVGRDIGPVTVTQADGLSINDEAPQSASTQVYTRGTYRETLALSYPVLALREGKVTIPTVKAVIDGSELETSPIEIEVVAGPEPDHRVHARVEKSTVAVGEPFWLYLEAHGTKLEIPDIREIEGFHILGRQSNNHFEMGRGHQSITARRGYYLRALAPGEWTIPSFEIQVSGRRVKTEPISLTVTDAPVASRPPAAPNPGPQRTDLPPKEDLVFIDMFVDKHEVYQGEPVLLTEQVWQLDDRRVNSGPKRGGLLMPPSTHGFYVIELEARSYRSSRNGLNYDVREQRKLLYPLEAGVATIGRWRLEYIALVNRSSIINRQSYDYIYEQGPIDIKVKPLPPAPPGFSGAVGEYTMIAESFPRTLQQGVPFALQIVLQGRGNPDALPPPKIEPVKWAHLSDPTRALEPVTTGASLEDDVWFRKRNTWTITPNEAGDWTLPEITFVHFSPREGEYVTERLGPFHFQVMPANEAPQHLTVADDLNIAESTVDVVDIDIHPVRERDHRLEPSRSAWPWSLGGFIVPVVLYGVAVALLDRRRRFREDIGLARAHHARAKGVKRLKAIYEADDPGEVLHQTVTHFIADKLGIAQAGLTSRDVEAALNQRGIRAETVESAVRILRACERARYGGHALDHSEVYAMVAGAEACMDEIGAQLKRGIVR